MKILKKRSVKIIIFLLCIISAYMIWHFYNATLVFHKPEYTRADISDVVLKENISPDDYMLIYKHTGVSPGAAKECIEMGNTKILNDLNDLYFNKPDYYKNYIAYPITAEERNKTQITPLVNLKKGDILVTFNTHTFDWRHGHCGLVLDDEGTYLLEHAAIGETSCITYSKNWGKYPGFVVLRYPDSEVASEAADYALKNLVDIEYNIAAGVIDKDKTGEKNPSSHCSHIVWQAYKSVGVDIDRDKSFIVSPKDIAMSEKLKVVQIFGIDPSNYNSRIMK